MHIYAFILLLYLLFDINNSLSACDEVDITFLVDTPSIIQNGENVIDFIASIVWSGSSEYSGFSVVLYGDSIPKDININIISLTDTVNIHQRQKEEEIIITKLDTTFKKIESLSKIRIDFPEMKSMKLLDAFKIATKQDSAKHKHKKQELFGKEYKNNNIGKHDDDKAYFIFDYENTLLISPYNEVEMDKYKVKNSNKDICSIFNHLNNNNINNNAESIHFIMGRDIDELEIFCNGRDIPQSLMNENTFFVMQHESVLDNEDFMENIFDITCPAIIETPEFSGDINLGNHDQWIDIKTIISAHLIPANHNHDETALNQLDPRSYILIKDYINDDNTFQENDYLLADKETFGKLKTNYKLTSPVIKIVRIVIFNENNNNPNYKVLKLFVMLPESATDYIFNAHITGDIPISIPADNNNHYQSESAHENKRLLLMEGNDREVVAEKGGRDVKLFSMNWKKEYTWKKTGVSTVKIGGGWFSSGPSIEITGRGIIELKAGYEFNVNVNAFFRFDWDRSQGKILIEFKIHGTWSIGAYFYAKLTGQVEAAINNLLNWGQTLTFWAGPVPIIFKPYVALNARVKTIPFSIYGGIHCTYKERFALGYYYKKQEVVDPKYSKIKDNTQYTLWTRKTYENIASVTKCAVLMYNHGWGSGKSCKWFDYNRRYGTCRCKGASGTLKGYIKYSSGWTAYVLGMRCSSTYTRKCSACNKGDIAVKSNGGSKSECGKSWFNFWSESKNWVCKRCRKVSSNVDTNVDKRPIRERQVVEKGCTKKFGVGNKESSSRCPVTQLGFDVILEPKIGVSLYVVINVYTRLEFVFPFRITVPEKNPSICGKSGGNNMCQSKTLMASFTIEALLNWYIGIALDIHALWGSSSNKLALETRVGKFTIMKRRSMGCLKLKGLLRKLNDFFKSRCCRNRGFSAYLDVYDNALPNPLIFEDKYDDKHKQVGLYYGNEFDYYESLVKKGT